MTIYEHAMLGIDGALAAGLHRRYGWPIVALAGFAAVLPDFDGLTLLLGANSYADGHRVWAHNLLVIGLAAAVVAAVACTTDVLPKLEKWLANHRLLPKDAASNDCCHASLPHVASTFPTMTLWIAVGVLAAYSHLFTDILFSAGKDLPLWGVPLNWPFSSAMWAYPMVPWGDVGVTIVFAAGMFAMLRWRAGTQPIAAATLATVALYIVLRGTIAH